METGDLERCVVDGIEYACSGRKAVVCGTDGPVDGDVTVCGRVAGKHGEYVVENIAAEVFAKLSIHSVRLPKCVKLVPERPFGFGLDANMNTLKTMKSCVTLTHWSMVLMLKNSR